MSPSSRWFSYATLLTTLLMTGCASVDEFPATAAEVNFDGAQGHTGWARHERTCLVRDVRIDTAQAAAARQPKCVAMKTRSHFQRAATISTGGAAK